MIGAFAVKYFKYLFSILLMCILIIQPYTKYTFAAQRFEISSSAYKGEVYDAGVLSDGMILLCGREHLYGYLDKDGNTAIDFSFSYAGSFSDGLAPASVPYGKLGYIDKSGAFAIEPGFDEAGEFSCGFALVRKGNKTGFIDKTGRYADIVKTAGHTPVSSFTDGVCWVENTSGKRAVMDTSGHLLTGFDFVWTGQWSDGVCWASKNTGENFNKIEMELIDKTGAVLINPGIYTNAGEFGEGVCWVERTNGSRIYLIDKEGNELLDAPQGRMPSQFCGGLCVNVGGDLLSVINKDGISIWSSKKYLPVCYGGFSGGAMLIRNQQDGSLAIMYDTLYEPPKTSAPVIKYEYETALPKDNNFEIVLLLNRPDALVNGQKTQIDPADARICSFVENDRTLLPMRFVAENIPGFTVTWDYLTDSALVRNDYISVLLKADTPSADVIKYSPNIRFYNKTVTLMDQPPVNMYDRLFLPVRALCDTIGVNVFYDPRGLAVISNTRNHLSYDDASQMLSLLSE